MALHRAAPRTMLLLDLAAGSAFYSFLIGWMLLPDQAADREKRVTSYDAGYDVLLAIPM